MWNRPSLFLFHLFIENVSGQLKDQASDVEEGHQAILSDLAVVRGNAQDIFQKMGNFFYIIIKIPCEMWMSQISMKYFSLVTSLCLYWYYFYCGLLELRSLGSLQTTVYTGQG